MNVSMISIRWKEITSLNISRIKINIKLIILNLVNSLLLVFTQIIRPVFITLVLYPHGLYEPLLDLKPPPSPSPLKILELQQLQFTVIQKEEGYTQELFSWLHYCVIFGVHITSTAAVQYSNPTTDTL